MAKENNGLLIAGLLVAGYLWWTSRESEPPAVAGGPSSGEAGTPIDEGGVHLPKTVAIATAWEDTEPRPYPITYGEQF